MQNAFKENMSGMVAIIGLDCTKVEKIITDNKLKVEVANDNSPLQVVISGTKEDLLKAENVIIKNGAKKFIYLNVSSAFHSRLMKNAEEKMKSLLNKVNFQNSSYYIISNFSAKETKDSKIIYNNLTKQMSNKVRWVESIKCLENLNESKIIEIGPGNVLSGLIKRISNKFTLFNINSIDDLYNDVSKIWNIIGLFSSVHPSASIRKEADKNDLLIQDYMFQLSMRKDLYRAVLQYSKKGKALNLKGERKRFLDGELRDFERSGLGLSEDDRRDKAQARLITYPAQDCSSV